MDRTYTHFVRALRNADVAVSPAEALDGLEILQSIGWQDRRRTRDALGLALAKSVEEKARFEDCFDRFYHLVRFTPRRQDAVDDLDSMPPILRALLAADDNALALEVVSAAERVHVDQIHFLRQKSGYARAILEELDIGAADRWIDAARGTGDGRVDAAARARAYLADAVKEYVDEQYRIHVDASGRRAVIEAALKARMAEIPADFHAELRTVIEDLAQKLIRRHKRRRRRAARGQLDIRRTLRRNVAHDGMPFDLQWRRVRRKAPRIHVLCDISGSMALVTRFFLMLLYELQDVLPDVRSFVFSNELAEVSHLFETAATSERAIEEALLHWGSGVTDYGRALCRFRELCHTDLDRRATLIVLGDARSNYLQPRADVMAELATRAGHVFWLNPETDDRWSEGDSEMRRYAPHCRQVFRLATLPDLERFADRLLTLL